MIIKNRAPQFSFFSFFNKVSQKWKNSRELQGTPKHMLMKALVSLHKRQHQLFSGIHLSIEHLGLEVAH